MRLKDDLVQLAFARIFATADGKIAHAALSAVVAEIITGDASALQEHNGRRKFAAELIDLAAMEPLNVEPRTKQRTGGGNASRRHGPAGRD
jgi:hypothetical protein